MRFIALFAVLAAVAAGCGSPEKGYDRVSLPLEQRSGLGLGTNDAGHFTWPPNVSPADGISEEEAVSTALWNNPVFRENLTKLGFARADLAQAGQLPNPSLSLLFPWGPKQLEFAATIPLEAAWLRPRRVHLARLEVDRVAQALVQSGLDLIRDVRFGFSDLQLARDRARLAREAIQLQERTLAITEGRLRAGEAGELEVTAARAELMRRRDDAHRADQDATLAGQRLRAVLGLDGAGAAQALNLTWRPEPAGTAPLPNLEQLEHQALAARPDLRAAEISLEAAGKRSGLAIAEIFALSGVIDANGKGKEGFEIGPGVQLPIPILNQNQGARARASAELERAAWGYAGTRQRILSEVRDAHERYQQASDAMEGTTRDLLPALEALARQSEKAYELGELSPLTVQEYARQFLAGRLRHAELGADLRRARAELERNVGTRLQPTNHPL